MFLALALKGEDQGDNNITQHSDISEAMGAPTTATRDVSGMTTRPVGFPSPSDAGNLTTITVPQQADAPGNQTRESHEEEMWLGDAPLPWRVLQAPETLVLCFGQGALSSCLFP